MIFGKDMIGKIVRGEKTQTRREAKSFECRYKVGHSYAVQPGRGEEQVARIKVTEVDKQRLGDMGADDAVLEGFDDLEGFKVYWTELHGGDWHSAAFLFVWVITFELDQDPPRFLAKQQGQASPPQYVNSVEGAIDDAEAIPEVDQKAQSKAAEDRWNVMRGEQLRKREDKSREGRLHDLQFQARNKGVDISRITRAIDEQLDDAERMVRPARRAA